MDEVKRKVMFNRPGGTASKNAMMARITLPVEYVQALGITPEERDVSMMLDDDKIIIRKADQ